MVVQDDDGQTWRKDIYLDQQYRHLCCYDCDIFIKEIKDEGLIRRIMMDPGAEPLDE